MTKKLGTNFPAARIKKIMEAIEEIGDIDLGSPSLVSKALKLFLQSLCEKTAKITSERGVKTLSALDLKNCVLSHSEFDFLKETVSKVPEANVEKKHRGKKRNREP